MKDLVEEGWRAGRAAWPTVDVARDEFTRYVAARAQDGAVSNAADLYLTCACARGDGAALTAFDQAFQREVRASVSRVQSFALSADELRQLLHERLFVGNQERAPRITEYAGRGELRTWVRLVATRLAINAGVRDGRQLPFAADALDLLAGASGDAEVQYLRSVYIQEFRAAFARALDELGVRERTLLRYAFSEGLTVDAIGALYNVHRATAARWIVRAHADLGERVKGELRSQLKVDEAEYASLLRMIMSRLEITLERYLGAPLDAAGAEAP